MATTKVVDILDRAGIILQDSTSVRFPKQELLRFFNDSQKEVVLHRPDAKMVNTTFDCDNGSKQTLPAVALRLIEVVRNIGGRAITQVQKRILDETLPNWHESTAVEVTILQAVILGAKLPQLHRLSKFDLSPSNPNVI